mmetsp:Transcript_83898/g.242579  ORF Transcript_83898/g.242579 Transcript_83898/m.242579 type:complete len:318 (+) Transcript_83898:1350-2303(+)
MVRSRVLVAVPGRETCAALRGMSPQASAARARSVSASRRFLRTGVGASLTSAAKLPCCEAFGVAGAGRFAATIPGGGSAGGMGVRAERCEEAAGRADAAASACSLTPAAREREVAAGWPGRAFGVADGIVGRAFANAGGAPGIVGCACARRRSKRRKTWSWPISRAAATREWTKASVMSRAAARPNNWSTSYTLFERTAWSNDSSKSDSAGSSSDTSDPTTAFPAATSAFEQNTPTRKAGCSRQPTTTIFKNLACDAEGNSRSTSASPMAGPSNSQGNSCHCSPSTLCRTLKRVTASSPLPPHKRTPATIRSQPRSI